jgi:hypothetical protein
MAKFRKKPVVIEAEQFLPGDGVRVGEDSFSGFPIVDGPNGPCVLIPTIEGEMRADYGDWIITGVKGERYPCKPDIFAATYESAEEIGEEVAVGDARG